jgi:hypothetical protein
MAEIDEEKTMMYWAKIIIPRVMKAAIWGFIMGGEILILMQLTAMGGQFATYLPAEATDVSYYILIFVIMELAIQLLQGTIFPYVLRTARALISMFVLVFITNSGVLTLAVQSSPEIPMPADMSIAFTIDFQLVLVVFLLLSMVSLVKNLLQAIEFLSEKAEEPLIPPELP